MKAEMNMFKKYIMCVYEVEHLDNKMLLIEDISSICSQ